MQVQRPDEGDHPTALEGTWVIDGTWIDQKRLNDRRTEEMKCMRNMEVVDEKE